MSYLTIDSASTRDIDDAFALSQTAEGYRLKVAIANPSVDLVPIDGPVDVAARRQAATIYHGDRPAQRMLPPEISEDASSLIAGQRRAAMVFDLHLDHELRVTNFSIHEDTITVARRCSYEEIPRALADSTQPTSTTLSLAAVVASRLAEIRRSKGAIALYDLSRQQYLDEDGRLQKVDNPRNFIGHLVVQEFMILTNTEVGRWLAEHDVPCLYRNHLRQANAPASKIIAAMIEQCLHDPSRKPMASGQGDGTFESAFPALGMARAEYGATLRGHYALNLPVYLHITSPLRRYADLVNMRQISAWLRGAPLPYTPDRLSALEALGNELNETVISQQEARSDRYKVKLLHSAERVVRRTGSYSELDAIQLGAVIKTAIMRGELSPDLVAELSDRSAAGKLTDDHWQRLLFKRGETVFPSDLQDSLTGALLDNPHQAAMLLNSGKQLLAVTDVEQTTNITPTGFRTDLSFVGSNGVQVRAHGTGSKKKEAEQIAIARALCTYFRGYQEQAWSDVDPEPAEATPPANSGQNLPLLQDLAHSPVSALQEYAQKMRVPLPSYVITTSKSDPGVKHTQMFNCAVQVHLGNSESGPQSFGGTGTSKQAAKTDSAANALRYLMIENYAENQVPDRAIEATHGAQASPITMRQRLRG